jgi:Holliday junction resolvasome RuvABC endonuclease subunit
MSEAPKAFLGIDASVRSSGVVVLRSGFAPLQVRIAPPASLGEKSFAYIYDNFEATIKLLGKVDMAAMEGPSFNSLNRPFDMGAAYGVFKVLMAKNKIPFVTVPPKSLKKFMTGNGAASKETMVLYANSLGLDSKQEDIADAFALALVAKDCYHGKAEVRTRAREEVVQQSLTTLVSYAA